MVYLWVDANVVLRFLTGDPPAMAAKALELMSRAEKGAIGLRVSHLVAAEIVWVLSSFYKYDKTQIAETLNSFLSADGIYAENPALLIQALQDMAEKNVDFVDAYLAALARAQEESICSFDNDFEKLNVRWVTPPGDG
ncbi:PIN domain-containing protein [Candidatus Desulforudis audaxviator]|uniref:PilT protein domain protein n=1 Tax=Desulforudis audaxviator (strain MP104C) TaxID=477974 RepID=B1I1W6_DESAP|nr:type II toxin-antitoxin system VapC family toxin [Candidatus Desulforudis audaxviator]ACA58929.1 PilT protein domain protein [Candidatus Desulforudis audaxviator MP104C]